MAFLYQVSAGTFRPGSLISALSMLATLLIVAAGWSAGRIAEPARGEQGSSRGLLLNDAAALVCLGALVLASLQRVHAVTVALALTGLLLAMARAVLTLAEDRRTSGRLLRAKNEDLLRYRSLVETSGDFLTDDGLVRSLEIEQPAVLANGRWEGESTLRDMRGGDAIPVAISSYVMFHPETGEPWALATVQRDITERLAAERSLQQLADERQVLLGRLVQAQEDERSRIASDVHDDSVQALAAVDLRLGMLRRQVQEGFPELLESVDGVRRTVEGATARLRHLLFDLESPARERDLVAALDEAASVIFDDDLSWTVRGDEAEHLSETIRVTAYRIAKEAMVNARRHANARHVTIELRCSDTLLELTVTDDGTGLNLDALQDRPGHLGMRDRATIAGGTLTLVSGSEGGAVLRLLLPVHSPT